MKIFSNNIYNLFFIKTFLYIYTIYIYFNFNLTFNFTSKTRVYFNNITSILFYIKRNILYIYYIIDINFLKDIIIEINIENVKN